MKNEEGMTAVMYAVSLGQLSHLRQFAKEDVAGVDWNTRDNEGNSLMKVATQLPADLATDEVKQEVIMFLYERLEKEYEKKIAILESKLLKAVS